MSDTVMIPHNASFDPKKSGPWWLPIALEKPLLCCPKGHRHQLDPAHKIASDGIVSPSLLCPDCGWHVYGRFLDWKESL